MRLASLLTLCSMAGLAMSQQASAAPHVRRGPTAPRLHAHSVRATARVSTPRPGMAPERATEIQNALIKAGYLNGTPSGTWDASSQAAMEKLQADNGWQTKIVPDSRAIIKLGLGPSNSSSTNSTGAENDQPHSSLLFAGESSVSRPVNQ